MRGLREKSGTDERTIEKGSAMTTGLLPEKEMMPEDAKTGEAQNKEEQREMAEKLEGHAAQTKSNQDQDTETEASLKRERG